MRVFAVLLAGYAALGAAKLDPPFKSEMHEPRAEDAGVIRALRGVDPETHFLLIHGHFVGGGKETVVAVALRPVQGGDEVSTILLLKSATGWKPGRRDYQLSAAYCRSLQVSAQKDLLLCWNNFSHGSVLDENLYALDFSQEPSDSWFFQVRDTTAAASPCRTWAALKSVNFDGVLHVAIDYGRTSSLAVTVPHHLYRIDFELGAAGFSPTEPSKKNFNSIMARWEEQTCSASK
jgi:hypothetical protein